MRTAASCQQPQSYQGDFSFEEDGRKMKLNDGRNEKSGLGWQSWKMALPPQKYPLGLQGPARSIETNDIDRIKCLGLIEQFHFHTNKHVGAAPIP